MRNSRLLPTFARDLYDLYMLNGHANPKQKSMPASKAFIRVIFLHLRLLPMLIVSIFKKESLLIQITYAL